MSLKLQTLTMLHMVGAGVWVGVALETYRRLRIKGGPWITFLQDLGFWLINSLIVFLWLLGVNNGQMRLYIFLSLLCGFAMYQAILRSLYRSFLERCIRFFRWFFHLLYTLWRMLIFIPLRWIYRGVVALLLLLFGGLERMGRGVYVVLRYLLLCLWQPGSRLVGGIGRWVRKMLARWKSEKK